MLMIYGVINLVLLMGSIVIIYFGFKDSVHDEDRYQFLLPNSGLVRYVGIINAYIYSGKIIISILLLLRYKKSLHFNLLASAIYGFLVGFST